jgi:uncharacterized protein (UPF0332 family)
VRSKSANCLGKARSCLGIAIRNFEQLELPGVAAKEAYLAGFHAAEAFLFERTGKTAKTHRGLRSRFAQLAQDEPRIDPAFPTFLGRTYTLKVIADYGVEPEDTVSIAEAQEAIDTARRFIDCIAAVLNEGSA